jgi:formiminoglutamase
MRIIERFDISCVEDVCSEGFTSNQIGSVISVFNADFFVQNKKPGLLLFSFCEDGEEHTLVPIRKAFYQLYSTKSIFTLADAGHFTGEDVVLPETLLELRNLGFIPLILTPNQSTTFYAYKSFCIAEETVNLLSVDDAPDLGEITELIGEKNWLTQLISHTPNFLFNYSLIAYQQYLSNPEAINILEGFHFDLIRLGEIRDKIKQSEPFFRNADIVSFDLGSVRSSDTGSAETQNPNGLYAEEACRLMRYAGHGGKIKTILISGFSSLSVNAVQTALIAQLIWHIADGFDSRVEDSQIGNDENYYTYTIGGVHEADELIFYKSVRSGRWWMRVPSFSKSHGRPSRHHIVPCNYEDYQQAMAGEIPETWWRTHQKLV